MYLSEKSPGILWITKHVKPKIKKHSYNEIFQLIAKAQKGNMAAKREVVTSNIGLVINIAVKYISILSSPRYDLDDLIQEGIIGLDTAITKFNTKYKTTFSTYAVFWVKQKITRYVTTNRSIVRIPNYAQELKRQFLKLKNEYPNREDTFFFKLLAKNTNLSTKSVENAISKVVKEIKIDKTINNKYPLQIENPIHPNEEAEREIRCLDIKLLLTILTPREQDILLRRAEGLTLQHIALELGITRERVRQIENTAKKKLKESIKRNSHAKWEV